MTHVRGCPLFTHPSQRGTEHSSDCRCSAPRIKPDGQAARLLRWLRVNPGATSLDVTAALFIVNVTGRVSDLRAAGYIVVCRKGPDHRDRYYIEEPRPKPLTGEQMTLGTA